MSAENGNDHAAEESVSSEKQASQLKRGRYYRRWRFLRLLSFALLVALCLLYGGLVVLYAENFALPTAQHDVSPLESAWMQDAQDVRLRGDGVDLAAWYLPPENGAAIILLHGYGGDRRGMAWHAEQLLGAGYGVLMVDLRGHGESGGGRRSWGWEDAADVKGMVDFLQAEAISRIGIVGHSIGGQVALRGAHDVPAIAAIIADGPSVVQARDLLPFNFYEDVFFYPANLFFDLYMAARLGQGIPAAVRDDIGDMTQRPILLIGGAAQDVERTRMQRYAAEGGDKLRLWLVEGGRHGTTWVVAPDDYREVMIDFFNTHLLLEGD